MRHRLCILAASLLSACSAPDATVAETQITSRVGVARSPVLSRDGTTISFAAVATGYQNPQVWVGRADGSGSARPLTNDESKNYDPEFTADGHTIYFTSSREPQGIYRVPSSGGQSELTIRDAYSAKISPDGNSILYGLAGKVVRRAFAGGQAVPVLPDVENSYAPLWSPDGSRILVTTTTPQERKPEWWLVGSIAEGQARRTSLGASLRAQGFTYIAANAWLPGDWLVFTGGQGERQTLWKIQLGANGDPLGKAVRATGDAEGDEGASFASGRLVFARTRVGTNFWSLPLDSSGEHVRSTPEPLTMTPVRKGQQSAAAGKLLYSAEAGDRFTLFLKQHARERRLRDGFYSALAPDGSKYAFGEGTKERLDVYVQGLSWWSWWSSKLCEACGMPRQFSIDGQRLLLWTDSPPAPHVDLMEIATKEVKRLISSGQAIMAPGLAPDGKWICFVGQVGSGEWQGFVAPVSENPPGASQWIPVTPPSRTIFYVFWSARADSIYILSSHGQGGNLRFLDSQPLDPATRHVSGSPATVYEFDASLVPGMDPIWNNVAVERNRIVIELGGISTDIWIR